MFGQKKKKGRYLQQFYNSFCSFYIVRFNDMLLSLPMYIIWHKWIIHARHANDRRPKNKTIPNCRTEKVQMNNTIIYANALYISHHTLLHHILFFFLHTILTSVWPAAGCGQPSAPVRYHQKESLDDSSNATEGQFRKKKMS